MLQPASLSEIRATLRVLLAQIAAADAAGVASDPALRSSLARTRLVAETEVIALLGMQRPKGEAVAHDPYVAEMLICSRADRAVAALPDRLPGEITLSLAELRDILAWVNPDQAGLRGRKGLSFLRRIKTLAPEAGTNPVLRQILVEAAEREALGDALILVNAEIWRIDDKALLADILRAQVAHHPGPCTTAARLCWGSELYRSLALILAGLPCDEVLEHKAYMSSWAGERITAALGSMHGRLAVLGDLGPLEDFLTAPHARINALACMQKAKA